MCMASRCGLTAASHGAGRLAMLACVGFLAAHAATGKVCACLANESHWHAMCELAMLLACSCMPSYLSSELGSSQHSMRVPDHARCNN